MMEISFLVLLRAIDFSTGVSTITFSGDTETFTIVKLDLVNGTLETSVSLSSLYEGLGIDENLVGNIFYSDGLIVFNNVLHFMSMSYLINQLKQFMKQKYLLMKAGDLTIHKIHQQ